MAGEIVQHSESRSVKVESFLTVCKSNRIRYRHVSELTVGDADERAELSRERKLPSTSAVKPKSTYDHPRTLYPNTNVLTISRPRSRSRSNSTHRPLCPFRPPSLRNSLPRVPPQQTTPHPHDRQPPLHRRIQMHRQRPQHHPLPVLRVPLPFARGGFQSQSRSRDGGR